MANVKEAIAELSRVIETVPGELSAISEQESVLRRPDGGWSRKQILGHLIDSATVNHQRFVRGQLQPGFALSYDQNKWVETQDYQARPWRDLIELWTALNRHILHLVRRIPDDRLGNLCGAGGNDGQPWTLSFRIADYISHMQHHLEQIRNLR